MRPIPRTLGGPAVRILLALAALALFLLPACGGARNFDVRGSQRDPGADARLSVERVDGGQLITITAQNLAPPERLGSGFTRYVVWVRAGSAAPQMEAVLSYDPGSRTARASGITPHERFTVVVSAERAEQPGSPSEYIVFTQNVSP